jgi:hypothetical protein
MGKVIEENHDLEAVYAMCIGQLTRGLHRRNHPFRQVAMATAEGAPNIRMVILRELIQDPLSIIVYTDNRSDKMSELRTNPHAGFLFWHPSSKFQLKLKTRVTIHHKDELAMKHYKEIGGKGRDSYNTSLDPGTKIDADKNPQMPLRDEYHGDDFCLLVCKVFEMEALQLRREGHIRARFKPETGDASFIVP